MSNSSKFAKKFCIKRSNSPLSKDSMAKRQLQKVVGELRGAVKSHDRQADMIEKHSHNLKKGGIDGKPCWKGYGIPSNGPKTKMKGGKRVDNCVEM